MPKSGVDLPAAKGNGAPGRPADDDLDLPTPRAAGGGAGAGDWRGAAALDDLDLPMPKAGEVDLPRAQGASDLPGTRGAPADQGFGPDALDLPLPAPRGALPGPDRPATAVPPAGDPARGGSASGGEAFGDLDLSPPSPAGAAGPTGADGPPADSLDLPEFDMALPGPDRPVSSMPPKRPSAPAGGGAGAPKAGAGGMDFGAIDLGGEVGDEMEFADLPEEGELDLGGPPGMPSLASVGPRPGTGTRRVAAAPADQSAGRVRVPRIVWALTALVGLACVVGIGLGWTPYGYFGRYFLERFLPAAGNVAVAEGAISRAETLAKTDTYEDVRQALALLAKERREYGLNRRLLARSLLHEHLYRARFGQDAASQSRAAAIAARLEERGGQAFGYDLARAAGALVDGRYGEAGGLLGRAARAAPRDPYVPLVQGELALATGDPEAASSSGARPGRAGGSPGRCWPWTTGAPSPPGRRPSRRAPGTSPLEPPLPGMPSEAAASTRPCASLGRRRVAPRSMGSVWSPRPGSARRLWPSWAGCRKRGGIGSPPSAPSRNPWKGTPTRWKLSSGRVGCFSGTVGNGTPSRASRPCWTDGTRRARRPASTVGRRWWKPSSALRTP